MSEKLISADKLIQFVENWGKHHGREEAADSFLYAINNAPAVDAVAVVRCGDCRHIVQIGNAYYCKVWRGHNGYGIDGFCCYGERREDNGVD